MSRKRTRRQKNDDGDGVVLFFLTILAFAVVCFVIEHPDIAIAIGLAIAAIAVSVIVIKHKRLYNRERRMDELGAAEQVDAILTDKILQAASEGKTVDIGRNDCLFEQFTKAYDLLENSEQIVDGEKYLLHNAIPENVLANNGIKESCKPIVLRYKGKGRGKAGYIFYVFPETVLAFFGSEAHVIFLAAYLPDALLLSFQETEYTTLPQIIYEKSQKPYEYYDKYCPIKDTEILGSYWKITNKDGSRSFRGGLSPEKNPLTFILKYGKITITLGNHSVSTLYSFCNAAELALDTFNEYKKSGDGSVGGEPAVDCCDTNNLLIQ